MIEQRLRQPRATPLAGVLLALLGGLLLAALPLRAMSPAGPPPATVAGIVVDASGAPVSGATVRIRATTNVTASQADGAFLLAGLAPGAPVMVTAWADGFYVAGQTVTPTVAGITLALRAYHTVDHPDYVWASPLPGPGSSACGDCHPMILPQWQGNAHGGAVDNARFFSLYNGTNLSGTESVPPGFGQDFPGLAGNCAHCHAPGAAVDGYLTTDMNAVRGAVTAGIHCDYCHKIGGVFLDPATGTVYPNAPGTVSQKLLRPPAGDDIFFGPYDDVPDPDSRLPAISESRFCAPCHQFSFWGTPIYASFDEWLASPYAAEGQTCQDCHMAPTGDAYFALPEVGGLPHPPETIPSHLQPGAADEDLLRETVTLGLEAVQTGALLQVTVTLTNSGAGHHVPTDHPGRHLILTLDTRDGDGAPLSAVAGTRVPAWGGDLAGEPGAGYARVLRDAVTGETPTVAYWRQTLVEEDSRLAALEVRAGTYLFALPAEGGLVTVDVRLVFRRLFQELGVAKGWDVPDVVMEEANVVVATQPTARLYVPAMFTP